MTSRDRRILYAAAFLRATATGMIGVMLGVYLSRLGFGAALLGQVVGAGLAGGALASLVATLWGDRHGRRRLLLEIALFSVAGGVALALASRAGAIAAAAFLGMANGMGRDRGASLILEQAILPSTAPPERRTQVFAWYNVLQDCGHALGSLLAGLPMLLALLPGLSVAAGAGAFGAASGTTPSVPAYRWSLIFYAALLATTGILYAGLSKGVEAEGAARRGGGAVRLTPRTRTLLWRISALFGLDSLGGGFLTAALLSYFFFERFHTSVGGIGLLFFGARLANAASHLGAAWLARRIGLVNTMVFTHVPSSLLLVTVAFAPSFPVAAALFLLREGLVEMDVPTRQSYVVAVVEPGERTAVSGVTHLVRVVLWAVAPFLAGPLMQGVSLLSPLLVGASLKILYDILLYAAFRRIHPPEEVAPAPRPVH